jgi:predicted ATP-grasp superfamily ATP-dependent carboligase
LNHELALRTKTQERLRQFPPLFGDGSFQGTVDAPEVAELGRRLVRAFDDRGFAGIEFKFDARDGTYRLIEFNPRTVSATSSPSKRASIFRGSAISF